MARKSEHRIRILIEMTVVAVNEAAAVDTAMSQVAVSTYGNKAESRLSITAEPVHEQAEETDEE